MMYLIEKYDICNRLRLGHNFLEILILTIWFFLSVIMHTFAEAWCMLVTIRRIIP